MLEMKRHTIGLLLEWQAKPRLDAHVASGLGFSRFQNEKEEHDAKSNLFRCRRHFR